MVQIIFFGLLDQCGHWQLFQIHTIIPLKYLLGGASRVSITITPHDQTLGGASRVSLTITPHDQTLKITVWYIHIMNDFLASKGSHFENVFVKQGNLSTYLFISGEQENRFPQLWESLIV